MAKPLTIIKKIKPGKLDALRDLLTEIGHDIRRNPHIRFPAGKHTHFARYVIIPGEMPAADTMDLEPHLVFTSNYDGDLHTYAEELIRITPALDDIWYSVEGYAGSDNFYTFLRENHIEPQAFYQGFRDETVQSVHNYVRLREKVETWLDNPHIREAINLILAVQRPKTWEDWLEEWDKTRKKIVTALSNPLVDALFPDSEAIDPYAAIRDQVARQAAQHRDLRQHVGNLADFEDLVVQNQMNILSRVKPGQLEDLLLRLSLINATAKITPPGKLSGIATIHYARWVVFDNGRHMLFCSNYDGTWERYIGDFVRDVSGGMNAIWRNTVDFPAGGPRDIYNFEKHIRAHQIRSLVFYSAYPEQTVLNILDDRQLAHALSRLFAKPHVIKALRRL